MSDLPKLGINTAELIAAVDRLLTEATKHKAEMGAVNWGDIGIADIEYRLSVLRPQDGPICMVLVEEASPDCRLAEWLFERLDKDKFPQTYFECEW